LYLLQHLSTVLFHLLQIRQMVKTIIIGEIQNRTEIGTLANSYSILPFNSDGTPDSSFGNAGKYCIKQYFYWNRNNFKVI